MPILRHVFLFGVVSVIVLAWSGEAPNAVAQVGPARATVHQLYLPLVIKSGAAGVPAITNFTANPPAIAPGGTSTLSWSVTGATSLTISPGIGTVTGASVNVQPSATTEYTLSATNASGTTTDKTTVTVSSASGGTGAFWLPSIGGNTILTTYGTSVAVDNDGGIHVAYALYSGKDNGMRPAYYAYCAANCASVASWSLTRLSIQVQDVRLVLDPRNGHPRMMIYTSNIDTGAYGYEYAACETGCTNNANWIITVVTVNYEIPSGRSLKNNRYFAIDPQGGAGFVYTDSGSAHTGTFYAHCSSACTNLANWTEMKLSDARFDRPVLVYAQDGTPHLAFGYFVWDDYYGRYVRQLYYAVCSSNCQNLSLAQWSATVIVPVIGDGSFSLRLRSDGLPRLALYPTSVDVSQMQAGQLYYLWCDDAPCQNANSWGKVSVGTPIAQGDGVDMILDATNRPRLAFQRGDVGVGYAWCDTNCAATAGWQARTLESTNAIMSLYPPGLPQHQSCPILTWLNGVRPSLALDSAGHPRVGYDAELWWGGTSPYVKCNIAVPVARFGLFQ